MEGTKAAPLAHWAADPFCLSIYTCVSMKDLCNNNTKNKKYIDGGSSTQCWCYVVSGDLESWNASFYRDAVRYIAWTHDYLWGTFPTNTDFCQARKCHILLYKYEFSFPNCFHSLDLRGKDSTVCGPRRRLLMPARHQRRDQRCQQVTYLRLHTCWAPRN